MSHENTRIDFLHECTESIAGTLKAPISPHAGLADCLSIPGGGYSRQRRLNGSKEVQFELVAASQHATLPYQDTYEGDKELSYRI